MEELRYSLKVIREVLVKTLFERDTRAFDFYEKERQAIYESDNIRATIIHIPRYPHLRNDKEIVIRRIFPVHHSHHLIRHLPVCFPELNLYPITHETMNLSICLGSVLS